MTAEYRGTWGGKVHDAEAVEVAYMGKLTEQGNTGAESSGMPQ